MSHTYANLLFHVVFSTKGRRPTIRPEFEERLWQYMSGLAQGEFGVARKVGGTEDHIHGLISLRTDISVAIALQKWKSLSSGWVHKQFPQETLFGWQRGYGAFSVSESNAEAVIRYIENQKAHHQQMTFEEEFAELLKRHGIERDPRDAWGDE
jgi:REP element-mobilizing transposase RayT